jgi:hypothetical protein
LVASAAAQVVPGHAVVAWKPPSGGAGGMKLVDRAGSSTDITGLDPATLGTSAFDGARAVLVDNVGQVFAGLGVDNRGTRTPRPLDVRKIALSGSSAASDVLHATVMSVPANTVWHVSDLKERADGSLLVAATETVFTANPMPATAAFLVAPSGAVTALSTAGFPAGSLLGIADAGDRFVGAFEQSFFVVNLELMSFPYAASGLAPFRVHQFVNVSAFGGVDVDADGTLIVCAAAQGSSIARVPHAAGATPVPVPGSPAGVEASDAIPAAGLVAAFALPRSPLAPLLLVDTLAGTTTTWSAGVVLDPVDIGVRRNPTNYGPPSRAGVRTPFLGSFGGLPRGGNAQFGFRIGGTPGAAGVLFAGFGRGAVPLPFGLVLLDVTRPIVALASLALPNTGVQNLPVPLPLGLRGTIDMQAVLLPMNPPAVEMTPGLELTGQ